MANYKYIARDPSGSRKEGLIQAASPHDILDWLQKQGFTPVSVNEMSAGVKKARRIRSRKRIKSSDLGALCWQLTTMLEGGIPITTAIETVSDDIENLQLQEILQHILEKMQKGESFSASVSEYPKVFNQLFCAMILAGETGGTLPTSLRRLATYLDNRDKLAKKVKGAVAYPTFVISFILLILVFIMTFIIPRFKVIFDQIGGKLPAFTQAFMGFYELLRHNIAFILGSILLIIIFTVLISKTRKGHYFLSRLLLSMPLLGKVFKQAFIAIFCRTMATLIVAGVSVLEVLDILSEMSSNDIIKSSITRTREHIVGGSNISLSMAAAGFFPNMVVKMIQVGEESGALPKVLDTTSDYYERKVDSTITTLMSLLEPIMIVTVGAIVMVIVLALYLPIFTMSDMAA